MCPIASVKLATVAGNSQNIPRRQSFVQSLSVILRLGTPVVLYVVINLIMRLRLFIETKVFVANKGLAVHSKVAHSEG